MNKPTTEALKELGRYLFFTFLLDGLLVALDIITAGLDTTTGEININWRLLATVTLFSFSTATARALDKLKHEHTKLTGEARGIVPF